MASSWGAPLRSLGGPLARRSPRWPAAPRHRWCNPAIIAALVGAGAQIRFVEQEEASLERVYMDLLEDESDEASDEEAAP